MKRELEEHAPISGDSHEQPAVTGSTQPQPLAPASEITLVEQPSGAASEATLIEKPSSPASENTLIESYPPLPGSGSSGRQPTGPTGLPVSGSGGDRFERRHKLGEGGQGEVWLAFDPKLDRYVALKEIKPGLHGSRDIVSGFRNEAKLTGELEHPNIVTVYEAEHMHESPGIRPAGSAPFYVMRVFGNRNLMKAISEFYARERTAEEQKLMITLSNVQTKPTSEHRQQLRAALEQFPFDDQQPSDRRLREAVQSYLDDPQALDGRSLHDAVRELHSGTWSAESERTLRELLRRFIHICNAVAYAHSRGLIHRDLKPQNVMLGGFGETLVVDWGLAKVVGRNEQHASGSEGVVASVRSTDETAMGSIKGTLAYMPPEQARGEITSLGPHSDIYSLGAILYSLLTGHPPITARNPREILDLVKAGRFPKPTECNPHVPKALEAVCLKALAKEPLDRYVTALELAADVARWLDDEPVSAWPEPFTIRAKRWVKSHQTAVTSTAAAILMATVTLTVMFVVVTGQKAEIAKSLQRETEARQRESEAKVLAQTNERRAIAGEEEAKVQRDAATTARQLAESNAKAATEQSQLALSTLSAVIFDLQPILKDARGGAKVSRRLLAIVEPQLKKVSTQFIEKSAIDLNTMFALIEIADTILQLAEFSGEFGSDLGSSLDGDGVNPYAPLLLYRRAFEIAQQLAAANPQDSKALQGLMISLDGLGRVHRMHNDSDDAIAQYQAALKIRRVLAEADPNDAQKQRDLSIAFQRLGDEFLEFDRTDDAVVQFQGAVKVSRALAEANPNDAQNQSDLSIAFQRLGLVFLKLEQTEDADAQFQEVLKIRRKLAEANPNDAQRQHDLSVAFERLGDVFLKLGRIDDALVQFQLALKIYHREFSHFEVVEENQKYPPNLATFLAKLGDVYLTRGRTDEALTQFEDASMVSAYLAAEYPYDAQRQRDKWNAIERLGDELLKHGRNDEALKRFQVKEKFDRGLVEEDPNNTQKQHNLAFSLEKLGDAYQALGRTDDALAQFQAALKIRRRVLDGAEVTERTWERDLTNVLEKLGDVFRVLGRTDDALAKFQDALKIRRRIAQADPNSVENQTRLAIDHIGLGDVHMQIGQFDQALERYIQGIAVLDAMIAKGESVKLAEQLKAIVERARQLCASAPIAIGDWDTLLKVKGELLPQLLGLRVSHMAKQGRLTDVAQAGAKLRELEPQTKDNLYEAACAYGLCSTLSVKDKPQPTEAEQAEQKKYLALSLTCLKEAVAAGYDNIEHMQQDTDLTPLRELPEFQALLKQRSEKKR